MANDAALDGNYYGDDRGSWRARTLWDAARGLPVSRRSVSELLETMRSDRYDLTYGDFVEEMRRTLKADLSYPIIMAPDGSICDGRHRLAKAAVLGEATIDVVELDVMPSPDGPPEP